MGAPGPPGGYDLHKYFRGPTQSAYPPQSGGYQPSSPGNSFHHQPSHGSYPPGSNSPSSFPPSLNAYPHVQISNYSYNATPPQQSGSPVYHGQQFMHYNQDHGLRTQVPYSTSPFSQQAAPPFSQPPSSPSHSNQPQSSLPLPSSISSNPKFSQTSLPSSPSSHPFDGPRLMALLTTQQSGGQDAHDDHENPSIPGVPRSSPRLLPSSRQTDVSSGKEVCGPPPPMSPALPSAPPVPSAAPGRLSSKTSKGRYLRGEHVIYDVDVRKPGEAQPQLEMSSITMYGSDPGLVLGRQIAVNEKYICYGLRDGRIRILNITNAQKILLRDHTQRVSDMVFFSESAHLFASASEDGRIFVRRIYEGFGEDGKITANILLGIQLVGDWEMCHPRLCWHPSTQEIIFVAIGKYVVTIDISKTEQSTGHDGINSEHPLVCHLGSSHKGISVTGQHDDVVTDLCVPASGPFRLTSASKDGTVRVWGEQKNCLSKFTPYDGNAVDAVRYISAPQSTGRQFLLTGGPSNQNIKLWNRDELPSKSSQDVWKCIQTLEFQSSSICKPEESFFNHIIGAPRAGLILIANAKKHAIYAIYIDFNSSSVAPRMAYLAEFSVATPILSFTVTDNSVNEKGEGIIKVFCVQTQAIQQYALDLSQCLPHTLDEYHSEGSTPSTPKKSFSVTQAQWTLTSSAFPALEKGHQNLMTTSSSAGVTIVPSLGANPGIPPRPTAFGSLVEIGGRMQQYVTEANRLTDATKAISLVPSKESQDGIAKAINPTFAEGSQSSPRLNSRPEVTREVLSSSNMVKPPAPIARRRSRSRSPARVTDMQYVSAHSTYSKHRAEKAEMGRDMWVEGDGTEAPPSAPVDLDRTSSSSHSVEDENYSKEEKEEVQSSSGLQPSTIQQLRSPHLMSPSDILSLAACAKGEVASVQNVSEDAPTSDGASKLVDVEDWQEDTRSSLLFNLKKLGSGAIHQNKIADISDDPREDAVDGSTIASILGAFEGVDESGTPFIEKDIAVVQNVGEYETELELPGFATMAGCDDVQTDKLMEEKKLSSADSDSKHELKSVLAKQCEAGVGNFTAQQPVKGRKSKNKNNVATSGLPLITNPSQSSAAPATLSECETVSSLNSALLDPGLTTQIATMQESLNQVLAIQRELQKQMTVLTAASLSKETKRLEGAFGQRMEKIVKANVDAMWARIGDEKGKREKQDRDRAQQFSTFISNFISKDMPAALERVLKKEIASLGPTITQFLLQPLQKSVSTGATETFQSAIEKILPQFEKTTLARLEAAMIRQLKTQFQTTGRQAMQESLRSGFESLVIPAFERSCQSMSAQLSTAFYRGMAEHASDGQRQCSSADTTLATTLQEVIGDASALAEVLKEDLKDSTEKLLDLVEAASVNVSRYGEIQQSKGSLPEKALSAQQLEQTLDPTIELRKLVHEGKMEEAFNKALSSSEFQLVSWLCQQLDPSDLSTMPPPLSQGVLLSLVRNLSFDLHKDTGHKIQWIKEAALALDLNDPRWIPHMRGCLEQSYLNCLQMIDVAMMQSEQTALKLVVHIINSLLSSCK